MRVSKAEEYGIRLVASLATTGGQLTTRELAEREGLPEPTVSKVVLRLRRAGLVEASRGRRGGYTLARPAEELSLDQVVQACAERSFDRSFCSRMSPAGQDCVHTSRCGLKPVWRNLEAVIASFLARVTVADVISGRGVDPGFRVAASGS